MLSKLFFFVNDIAINLIYSFHTTLYVSISIKKSLFFGRKLEPVFCDTCLMGLERGIKLERRAGLRFVCNQFSANTCMVFSTRK